MCVYIYILKKESLSNGACYFLHFPFKIFISYILILLIGAFCVNDICKDYKVEEQLKEVFLLQRAFIWQLMCFF